MTKEELYSPERDLNSCGASVTQNNQTDIQGKETIAASYTSHIGENTQQSSQHLGGSDHMRFMNLRPVWVP